MSARLKAWLRKPPQPVAVMCDGKRVDVPKNGRPWLDLSSTITAMAPSKLEAIGQNGEILRAKTMEAADIEESDEPSRPSQDASDLQRFATLLAEAYDKSGKNFAPLLDSAMNFIARQAEALALKDKEIGQLRTHNHKLQAELILATASGGEEGAEPSITDVMLQAVMQGQANRQQPAQQLPGQRPVRNGLGRAARDRSVPTKAQLAQPNGRAARERREATSAEKDPPT